MAEILNPTVYGYYAALVNHPAYYFLFGLYTDYPLNNAFALPLESQREVQRRLREIQPLLWHFRPYRKSYALRLFTEREALARFAPEKVDEAWRQLRQIIEQVGPPARWAERREGMADKTADAKPPREAKAKAHREALTAPTQERRAPTPPWPRSPVNYDQEA